MNRMSATKKMTADQRSNRFRQLMKTDSFYDDYIVKYSNIVGEFIKRSLGKIKNRFNKTVTVSEVKKIIEKQKQKNIEFKQQQIKKRKIIKVVWKPQQVELQQKIIKQNKQQIKNEIAVHNLNKQDQVILVKQTNNQKNDDIVQESLLPEENNIIEKQQKKQTQQKQQKEINLNIVAESQNNKYIIKVQQLESSIAKESSFKGLKRNISYQSQIYKSAKKILQNNNYQIFKQFSQLLKDYQKSSTQIQSLEDKQQKEYDQYILVQSGGFLNKQLKSKQRDQSIPKIIKDMKKKERHRPCRKILKTISQQPDIYNIQKITNLLQQGQRQRFFEKQRIQRQIRQKKEQQIRKQQQQMRRQEQQRKKIQQQQKRIQLQQQRILEQTKRKQRQQKQQKQRLQAMRLRQIQLKKQEQKKLQQKSKQQQQKQQLKQNNNDQYQQSKQQIKLVKRTNQIQNNQNTQNSQQKEQNLNNKNNKKSLFNLEETTTKDIKINIFSQIKNNITNTATGPWKQLGQTTTIKQLQKPQIKDNKLQNLVQNSIKKQQKSLEQTKISLPINTTINNTNLSSPSSSMANNNSSPFSVNSEIKNIPIKQNPFNKQSPSKIVDLDLIVNSPSKNSSFVLFPHTVPSQNASQSSNIFSRDKKGPNLFMKQQNKINSTSLNKPFNQQSQHVNINAFNNNVFNQSQTNFNTVQNNNLITPFNNSSPINFNQPIPSVFSNIQPSFPPNPSSFIPNNNTYNNKFSTNPPPNNYNSISGSMQTNSLSNFNGFGNILPNPITGFGMSTLQSKAGPNVFLTNKQDNQSSIFASVIPSKLPSSSSRSGRSKPDRI